MLRKLLIAFAVLLLVTTARTQDSSVEDFRKGAPIISVEQLESNDGKDGSPMWLAIMGEVYDVTKGPEYYGEGGPYSIFVARDGSVPFITGKFTPEEAEKGLEVLDNQQLMSLDEWRLFYVNEPKYPFVGLLEGRLYDSSGTPSKELLQARKAILIARLEAEIRRKEAEKKRKERRKQRELERKRKEKEQQDAGKADL